MVGILILAALAVFFVFPKPTIKQSQAEIVTAENSFKINFNLESPDKENISQLFEKLQISQNVLKGVTFELDSTSSAKLAFANPISANIQSQQGKISFSGTAQTPPMQSQFTPPSNYKMPQSALFVLFAPNFLPQVQKLVGTPTQLANWIDQNLDSQNGQLLQLFPEGDFVLAFNSKKEPDFTSLAQLEFQDQIESPYIQQIESDVNIHIVKITKQEGETTVTFFKIGDEIYIASSTDAAKQIIAVQKENAPSVDFPKTDDKVSAVVFLKNPENKDINLTIFGSGAKKLEKYLKNLKEGQVILKGTKISGYVTY